MNKMGEILHTLEENAELWWWLVGYWTRSKADKTNYLVISGDQNAGTIPIIMNENSSSESVEVCLYMGTTSKNSFLFRKKLRADLCQRMYARIRCKIFCFKFVIQKFKDQNVLNYNFVCCSVCV